MMDEDPPAGGLLSSRRTWLQSRRRLNTSTDKAQAAPDFLFLLTCALSRWSTPACLNTGRRNVCYEEVMTSCFRPIAVIRGSLDLLSTVGRQCTADLSRRCSLRPFAPSPSLAPPSTFRELSRRRVGRRLPRPKCMRDQCILRPRRVPRP